MNDQSLQGRVLEIVGEVLDAPQDRWPQLVATAAGPDQALAREVWRVLRRHEDASGFMEEPLIELSGIIADVPEFGVGAQVGRYRIAQHIGSGSMGDVYEAVQTGTGQKVALKLLRPGSMTPQSIRRFSFEIETLAKLDHPHIGRIYDADLLTTSSGLRPFFAMELVRGQPITVYCDGQSLPLRARLELLARVCDAVQHAHAKGVIHRDLKPGNILVDEFGQPTILDFGIARATDADLQHATMKTDMGVLMGTVPYMSPEQLSGNPDDLDTRSDVYALGVIAYEVLVGRLPYDLRRRMILDAARIIREQEPQRLSSVNRALRGDVETIVATALDKDKARRYQSAESMASDIRRFLKNEPISARASSSWYQIVKFSRRNTGLVGGVIASLVVLSAGLVATLWQAGVARGERDRARVAEVATSARAGELRQVAEFQQRMLAQVDATEAGRMLEEDVSAKLEASLAEAGLPEAERARQREAARGLWAHVNRTDATRDLIDRTILRPAVQAIDAQFKDQPVVDAALRQVLADQYRNMGLLDAALPLQERALAVRRERMGEQDPDTLASINSMGELMLARAKWDEAERFFREALEKRRLLLGDSHPDTLLSLNNVGSVLYVRGELDDAEPCLRGAVDGRRRVLGDAHPDTLTSINNLALLLQARRDLAGAELLFREALDGFRRVRGENDPATMNAVSNMGTLLYAEGKPSEAEPLFRETMNTRKRALGAEHPEALRSINNLGVVLQTLGRLEEAEPICREALQGRLRVLGETHSETLTSMNNLAELLRDQGNFDEAERLYRTVLQGFRLTQGDDGPNTVIMMGNIGVLLHDRGRPDKAEPYFREALEKQRLRWGDEHPETLRAMNNLGQALKDLGRLDDAELCLRQTLDTRRRVLGEEHPDTLISIANFGSLLEGQGKTREAETVFRESMEKDIRVLGPTHPDTLAAIGRVGRVLQGKGELDEAEAMLLPAATLARAHLPPHHKMTVSLAKAVVNLYVTMDRAHPGKGYGAKAADWTRGLESRVPGSPASVQVGDGADAR